MVATNGTPNGKDPETGRFLAGNRIASTRSNGVKRRELTAVMFDEVTPAEFGAMIKNMLRIAKSEGASSQAVKAFSTICDILGLKSSVLEIADANAGESYAELRARLQARLAELRPPAGAAPPAGVR